MDWPFNRKQPGQKQAGSEPFLSPLSQQRSASERLKHFGRTLPSAAAPIAFMLVGGLTLIVLIATFLGNPGHEPAPVSEAVATTTNDAAPARQASLEQQPASAPERSPEPPIEREFTPVTVEPDPAATASILSVVPTENALRPDVEIAETEAEIAALEAIQQQEVQEDIGVPEAETAVAAVEEPATEETVSRRAARTTGYVNMRAQGSDDAEVLMVVPAQARIEAEADCNWCSVVHDGRSGYIYRTFIAYE